MKNRIAKTLLATTLCVAMVGTTCFAAGGTLTDATTGGSIEADNKVENPTYRVVVPTVLDFAIDPFEQQLAGHQVYSENLSIVNKSNVPVKVDVKLKAVEKGGTSTITFQDTADDVDESGTAKNLFLAAEVPSAVEETEGTPASFSPMVFKAADGTENYYVGTNLAAAQAVQTAVDTTSAETALTANEEVKNKPVIVTPAASAKYSTSNGITGTDTTLTFALAGSENKEAYNDATDITKKEKVFESLATNQDSSALFRFTGKVNTKATWEANKITATVAYDFIGLSGNNYTDLHAATVPDDGATGATAHGLVKSEAVPSIATTTCEVATGNDATWTVDLGRGDKAATGIASLKTGSTVIKAANYSLSGGTLTIPSAVADNFTTFTVTFNDSDATTVALTVTRP